MTRRFCDYCDVVLTAAGPQESYNIKGETVYGGRKYDTALTIQRNDGRSVDLCLDCAKKVVAQSIGLEAQAAE